MADMVEVENAVRRTWVRELWMRWVPQQQVEVSLIAFLVMFSLAMRRCLAASSLESLCSNTDSVTAIFYL